MPPSVDDRLLDISSTIAEIEAALVGKSLDDFLAERPTRLMIERLLEIVCEATRRLPEELRNSEPRIAWREIVNFGNVLRHAYHATEPDIVWEIVHHDLPILKAFAEEKLKQRRR